MTNASLAADMHWCWTLLDHAYNSSESTRRSFSDVTQEVSYFTNWIQLPALDNLTAPVPISESRTIVDRKFVSLCLKKWKSNCTCRER